MTINIVPTRIVQTHWQVVDESAQKVGRTADRSKWRVAREIYVSDTSENARKEALGGVLRKRLRAVLPAGSFRSRGCST